MTAARRPPLTTVTRPRAEGLARTPEGSNGHARARQQRWSEHRPPRPAPVPRNGGPGGPGPDGGSPAEPPAEPTDSDGRLPPPDGARRGITTAVAASGVRLFIGGVGLLVATAIGSRFGIDYLGVAFVPIAALLFAVAASRRITRTHPDESWVGRWLIIGVLAKITASYVRYLTLVVGYEGNGDASGYDHVGRQLARAWMGNGTDPGLETLRQTNFVRWFTGVVYFLFGSNMVAGFFLFGLLALLGSYLWYRATVDAVPFIDKRLYLGLVLFAPSIMFWPSSIGKESLMQLGIGAMALGTSYLVRQNLLMGLIYGGGGGWLLWVVRPHLLALVTIAAGFAYIIGRVRPSKEGSGNVLVRSLGLVVVAVLVAFSIGQGAEFLGIEDLSLSSVETSLDDQKERSAQGGSSFDNGGNYLSPVNLPRGIVTVLLRPFPWETDTPFQLLASLESAILGCFIIVRLSSLKYRAHPSAFHAVPALLLGPDHPLRSHLRLLREFRAARTTTLARAPGALRAAVRQAHARWLVPGQVRGSRAVGEPPGRARSAWPDALLLTSVRSLPLIIDVVGTAVALSGPAPILAELRMLLADLEPGVLPARPLVLEQDAEGRFRLLDAGTVVVSHVEPALAAATVAWRLNAIAASTDRHLVIHAGCVGGAGAVLLPARSGAGKSTLVAACLAAGMAYLSDEFAVVDLDVGTVIAYAKPLGLDDDLVAPSQLAGVGAEVPFGSRDRLPKIRGWQPHVGDPPRSGLGAPRAGCPYDEFRQCSAGARCPGWPVWPRAVRRGRSPTVTRATRSPQSERRRAYPSHRCARPRSWRPSRRAPQPSSSEITSPCSTSPPAVSTCSTRARPSYGRAYRTRRTWPAWPSWCSIARLLGRSIPRPSTPRSSSSALRGCSRALNHATRDLTGRIRALGVGWSEMPDFAASPARASLSIPCRRSRALPLPAPSVRFTPSSARAPTPGSSGDEGSRSVHTRSANRPGDSIHPSREPRVRRRMP